MLYSRSRDVALAHYPKTAGHSLVEWFRSAFPDAVFAEPPQVYDVSHLPVRESLQRLGLVTPPAPVFRNRVGRFLDRAARRLGRGGLTGRCPTRIIGVIREPFEMLVSLFEYWRAFPFAVEPEDPFIATARSDSFRDFLHLAVVRGRLWRYEAFFDAGGPAWSTTRLVDFRHLDAGLAAVCREFGIQPPEALPRRNSRFAGTRDLGHYKAAAGSLLADVDRHFGWYGTVGTRIMIRGGNTAA